MTFRCAICAVILVAVAGRAATNDQAPAIQALVRGLGSQKYEVRKRAAEELRKAGYAAVPALEAAEKSDDPEVASAAREILADARLGITSAWPRDIVEKIRQYDALSNDERQELTRRILAGLQEEAVPFLLNRLRTGNERDLHYVCDVLKACGDEKTARRLVDLLKKPEGKWEARALAWAHLRLNNPREALKVLVGARVEDDQTRSEIVEKAVKDLVARLKLKKYEETAKDAADFAAAEPAEARFLYLEGEALRQMNKRTEATNLWSKALGLNPDKEAPHYLAGDMLMDMERDNLSIREWELILKIDPIGDVYDINAHLRLGQIYTGNRRYRDAANHLEKALELYRKQRAGGHGGFGMIGADEAGLEATIKKLRSQGEEREVRLVGEEKGRRLALQVRPFVKTGKLKELKDALASAKASMTVHIEPLGMRLLDLDECRLTYNPEKDEINVLLNNEPCCEPQKLGSKGRKATIAVHSLDCIYFFDVDPKTGLMRKLSRFEKDYSVRILPDKALKDYKASSIKVGESQYLWEDLLKGATFDYLPDTLKITLEGTTKDGQKETLNFSIPITESELKLEEEPEPESN